MNVHQFLETVLRIELQHVGKMFTSVELFLSSGESASITIEAMGDQYTIHSFAMAAHFAHAADLPSFFDSVGSRGRVLANTYPLDSILLRQAHTDIKEYLIRHGIYTP
ncbi:MULTISPECIES: hypothetical protein [Caballeronia]|uniref:hypothetical protein n=1 Tax=Caballeronia TaxID=1827195 RepID=UPI001FD1A120|nr:MULTISPECIES: hypothetical protein [Caballeronia]MDR5799006.1 hypothetical protein [Caballeronia sp. LZ001]